MGALAAAACCATLLACCWRAVPAARTLHAYMQALAAPTAPPLLSLLLVALAIAGWRGPALDQTSALLLPVPLDARTPVVPARGVGFNYFILICSMAGPVQLAADVVAAALALHGDLPLH